MQFEDVFWENNNYMIIEEDITDSKAAYIQKLDRQPKKTIVDLGNISLLFHHIYNLVSKRKININFSNYIDGRED